MKQNNGMWAYLDQLGVLDTGSDVEIKKAKLEYRKLYKREYQRQYRANHPEFSISLTKEEETIISDASRIHNRSRTAYIKESSLAYTRKLYLVPDPEQLARLEQILNGIYLAIKDFGVSNISTSSRYMEILAKVEQIERKLSLILRHPPEITSDNDPKNH